MLRMCITINGRWTGLVSEKLKTASEERPHIAPLGSGGALESALATFPSTERVNAGFAGAGFHWQNLCSTGRWFKKNPCCRTDLTPSNG